MNFDPINELLEVRILNLNFKLIWSTLKYKCSADFDSINELPEVRILNLNSKLIWSTFKYRCGADFDPVNEVEVRILNFKLI